MGFALAFLIFMIFMMIANGVYLFTHPEELFGASDGNKTNQERNQRNEERKQE